MASDGRNLVRGAAGLGQSPRRRFAQAVGRTVRKARLIALLPKPAAKCGSLERSTAFGGQECQVVTRNGRNDRRKASDVAE
jgi:hypothetical protein